MDLWSNNIAMEYPSIQSLSKEMRNYFSIGSDWLTMGGGELNFRMANDLFGSSKDTHLFWF